MNLALHHRAPPFFLSFLFRDRMSLAIDQARLELIDCLPRSGIKGVNYSQIFFCKRLVGKY